MCFIGHWSKNANQLRSLHSVSQQILLTVTYWLVSTSVLFQISTVIPLWLYDWLLTLDVEKKIKKYLMMIKIHLKKVYDCLRYDFIMDAIRDMVFWIVSLSQSWSVSQWPCYKWARKLRFQIPILHHKVFNMKILYSYTFVSCMEKLIQYGWD